MNRCLHRLLFEIDFERALPSRVTELRPFPGGKNQWSGFAFLAIVLVGRGVRCRRSQSPHQGAAWDFDEQIFSRVAVHSFAQSVLAIVREEPRLVKLRDKIVQVVVGLQNDISSAPAVAAGRAAFGPERFTEKSNTTLSAVAGARKNFDFVDEHAICPRWYPWTPTDANILMTAKPERCSCLGERARLGRSGLRPRGPHGTRKCGHCLERAFTPVFRARARRTAAEAAALPTHFDCIVPAKVVVPAEAGEPREWSP